MGKTFLWAATLALAAAARAEAYVDPATGSFVLQMLIAGFVGALFAIKLFWHRLVGAIKGLFRRSPQPGPPQPGPDEG